jgi:predicted thioesterase
MDPRPGTTHELTWTVTRDLPAGASAVGTMVEMRHLAAMPVGMSVRGKAARSA